jgi:ABC-type antimicrobial peptide transport system permease subunit
VYLDQSLGGFTLTNPALPTQGGQPNTEAVNARSDAFYNDSLDSSISITPGAGTVPGIISSDMVLSLANITFSDTDTSAFKVAQTLKAEDAWRGKVLILAAADPAFGPQELKVTIEGFLPSGSLFGGGQTNTIILPLNAAQASITHFPSATQDNTTFYASFANQADLLAFAQNEQSPRGTSGTFHRVVVYGNPLLQLQEIESQGKSILAYVVIVLLVAVALAMLTTLSKIIADSERETGVFRAIGARVADILQIYITYSTLVSVSAMILAVGIGAGVAGYLSFRYSDNLTYELLTLSGSSNLTTHISLFGINWLDIGGIFLAIFIAALVGALVPLISLLRKDPINALRAE